jgi:flagellar FliL protein
VAEETPQEGAGKPEKKGNKLPLIVAVALVAVGIGGWLFLQHKKAADAAAAMAVAAEQAKAQAQAQAAPEDSFFDLDEFLVNLANPEGERYLRTTMSLSFTHETARDTIKNQLPKIRDAIIDTLSNQKTQDLSGPDGREKVKEAVLARLEHIVPGAGFDGVYFQLFTFQ